MSKPPKIENAPGLTWRPRKHGWEARWRARPDLIRRGYVPAVVRLWASTEAEPEPSETAIAYIIDRCNVIQDDMLVWGRGGNQIAPQFDETLAGLIRCYQTDKDSTYKKLRYQTRDHYDGLCRRIQSDTWMDGETKRVIGQTVIAEIKGRMLLRWHETWLGEQNKVSIAHSLIGMLRTLINFGATILEDKECERVAMLLHKMKFAMGKPRTPHVTAEQVSLLRQAAHAAKVHSIAMAQAFQFDCILRQKDVIGEWVPMSEPGITDTTFGNSKWLRGLRWEEIDQNLVLHHVTSKRNKLLEVPLAEAPMVMEELRLYLDVAPDAAITRDMLPATGPIILHDRFGTPWVNTQFRRRWRQLAKSVGIPDNVKNMDSRAGAISEATDAGADLEHVRHAATHGDIAMTQRYSRNSQEKIAGVMRTRVAHRNKTGNN